MREITFEKLYSDYYQIDLNGRTIGSAEFFVTAQQWEVRFGWSTDIGWMPPVRFDKFRQCRAYVELVVP
jgi:hypothetical protein